MEEKNEVKNVENIEQYKNVENDKKKRGKLNKKITTVLIVIVILLLLAMGVTVGLLIKNGKIKIINNTQQSTNQTQIEENKTSRKIDESKDWVYDIEYLNGREDKKFESYIVSKEIKTPFININSEDAKKANEEIKQLYDELYVKFGTNATSSGNAETHWVCDLNYKYFLNDNILSILISYGHTVVPGGGNSYVKTYNFNLDTLKYATFDEICKVCGFASSQDAKDKIDEWELKEINSPTNGVVGTFIGVKDGEYYIDSNRRLNIAIKYSAAGKHEDFHIFEVNDKIEKEEIIDELENEKGNDIFNNITSQNFKIATIKFLQEDYSYHTLNSKDFELAQKIINIAKTLELEEKEYKSFPEMNCIVIEYDNEHVVLRYDNSSNKINISTGSGDTFKVWENTNTDKVNEIKEIVNNYKKNNPDKVEKEVNNSSQEIDYSAGLYDNLYNQEMYECEYFKMTLPNLWSGKYRVDYEEQGNRKDYMFFETEHNEALFNITISDGKLEGDGPFTRLYDRNGTTEYYYTTRGDGPVYLEPISSMLGNFSGIENNLYIKKTLTNEYGDGTKTINVYGRQFIQIAGATGRDNIYYINQNSMLCRTNLVDLSTEILASSVKDIQIDQNNIIHAYPLGDSFMNNICMEDEFVKYEDIN